ncbi:DUF3152 domain-containing protein [Streptomyces sp. NPDC088354]|uniref:DUF3152 domain-containing protein n=1 Tax=Streptomyces sp. NPDC088354 TaxID=3365856 RepID=UPI0037FBCD99
MKHSPTDDRPTPGPARGVMARRLAVPALFVAVLGLVVAQPDVRERVVAVASGRGGSSSLGGSAAPHVPQHGDGRFTAAPAGSGAIGHGTWTLRYAVEVEDGTGYTAASVAREVDRILGDRRGWTAEGIVFRRVAGPPYDFVVRLATPDTTDRLCGSYGLDTGGEVNCSGGKDVVVNLKRWVLLSPFYKNRTADYRALIINHEVGHRLGHGHQDCPGPGRPAPAMMQQIKGLHGCVPNPWPYDAHGQPINGPAAP